MYRCRRSHINPLFAYLFCSQPNFSHTDTASERIASKSLEKRCRAKSSHKEVPHSEDPEGLSLGCGTCHRLGGCDLSQNL